ncbi:MAG: replication and repair protein RadC [Gammaproteobacteria bacterium]|jgi:DNA repair protein RadC|nr:replication and repair protein RadC [Gammaproteobacteria bacterium]
MPITDWPDTERPREKLLLQGAGALSNAELLAIALRIGVKGETAVDLARRCLKSFGGLRKFMEADYKTFCSVRGLGKVKYIQLQASFELVRRHLHETLIYHDVVNSPSETRLYLTARMRSFQHEVFACLFLDSRNRILCFEEMSHGSLTSAHVYPREVVKRALFHNAAAIILAHNHPSGVAEPSVADIELTQQLKQALELIQVQVLDHFVIGNGQTVSFAERGLL